MLSDYDAEVVRGSHAALECELESVIWAESNPTILAKERARIGGAPGLDGRRCLALGLLHGEVADDGQLEPLAFAGFENGDQPEDEEADRSEEHTSELQSLR